jgi:hypothetical protein
VTQFFCVSYGPRPDNVHGIFYPHVSRQRFSGIDDAISHNKVIRDYVDDNEWCIVADLDEFYSVPGMKLTDAIQQADIAKCTHLRGIFYDRITSDGSFPAHLEDNLWKQFPLSVNATAAISRGCNQKVCAVRGYQLVGPGHHTMETKSKPWPDQIVKVYHFKWWGSHPAQWFGTRPNTNPQYLDERERLASHLRKYGRLNTSLLTRLE